MVFVAIYILALKHPWTSTWSNLRRRGRLFRCIVKVVMETQSGNPTRPLHPAKLSFSGDSVFIEQSGVQCYLAAINATFIKTDPAFAEQSAVWKLSKAIVPLKTDSGYMRAVKCPMLSGNSIRPLHQDKSSISRAVSCPMLSGNPLRP